MVRKSSGKMRRSRKKMSLESKLPITRFLNEFSAGDRVHVDIQPTQKVHDHKFKGHTGTVIGKRGNGYIVEIRDYRARKTLMLKPEHLKLQKLNKS